MSSDILYEGYLDRRAHRRYPIELEFDLFHLWGANHLLWAGAGRTADWSRTSILIPWDRPLETGSSVELVVRWSPLAQLVVTGRVLKVEPRGVVVKMVRHRFQAASQPAAQAPERDSGHVRAS